MTWKNSLPVGGLIYVIHRLTETMVTFINCSLHYLAQIKYTVSHKCVHIFVLCYFFFFWFLCFLFLHWPHYWFRPFARFIRQGCFSDTHYNDIIIGAIASQITSLTIVHSIVYSDADQRKHQCSASLAFVRGIHRGPVNSPHKWPVTRKMVPFDDVIMEAMCDLASDSEITLENMGKMVPGGFILIKIRKSLQLNHWKVKHLWI